MTEPYGWDNQFWSRAAQALAPHVGIWNLIEIWCLEFVILDTKL